jgi:hypothetical protein
MKPRSVCLMTFTGLVLTAGLAVAGSGLARLHPTHDLASVELIVNCSGDFGAQADRTEERHIRQYSACLYLSDPVESARSVSQCPGGSSGPGGNCGGEAAQNGEGSHSDPDVRLHWRL